MKNLFVGQLVRVIGASRYPELIGSQCAVTAINVTAEDIVSGGKVYGVIRTDLKSPGDMSKWAAFYPENLEPILYDGAQPIAESFEEMMGNLREGVVA